METTEAMRVIGRDGLNGVIVRDAPQWERSTGLVLVRWSDGTEVWVPENLLTTDEVGNYSLPLSRTELNLPEQSYVAHDGDTITFPVIAEQVDIRKRTVETGVVRINKIVREFEQTVNEPLLREEVSVERVPINRMVDEPIAARTEGDTLIVPLFEEVLVVQKRLKLTEELHITKRKIETQYTETVALRSEEASVERVTAQ